MSETLITKPLICRALIQRGLGTAAMNLANNPAEDSFGVVNALVEGIDSEVAARVDKNPLLLACASQGIANGKELAALVAKAAVGTQARAALQQETYEACVRAHGADLADVMAKGWDDVPYASLATKRDAYEAEAAVLYRNGKVEGAKRQSAAPGTVVAKGVDEPSNRAFDRLAPEMQAKVAAQAPTDPKRQDELAADFLRGMGEVA